MACMGDRRDACKMFVGRPEGKELFRRPRHRLEGNIKIYLQELEYADMDWTYQAQNRDRWQVLVIVVMNIWVS